MRLRRAQAGQPTAGGHCDKHTFELAQAVCISCRAPYCADCIVMPFGANRPLCVGCALVKAGLRRRPVLAGRAS